MTIANPTDSVPYNASQGAKMTMSGTLNGVTVTLSGAPSDGDSFSIGPYAGGTSDGANALALSQLVTAKSLGGGTTTLTGAYANYVNAIGNTASQLGRPLRITSFLNRYPIEASKALLFAE